jgi:hypothetical protein
MQKDMRNFDWVEARFECSPIKVFERLREEVQRDGEMRKNVRQKDERLAIEFLSSGQLFGVVREYGTNRIMKIIFTLDGDTISVRDYHEKTILEAQPTLSGEGECRLRIDGQEREFWQVRMMALENIFFGSYS